MARFEDTGPRWIMTGMVANGRHIVLASNDMSQIDLDIVRDDLTFGGEWPPPIRHIEIRGRVHSYVQVDGESFADCISKLFNERGPEGWGQPKTLAEGQRGLPARDG